jgi:transposase
VIDPLKARGVEVVIPPKSNRKEPRAYDKVKYMWRHGIENFFGHLKQFRGIATRYDKLSCTFLSGIHLAAFVLITK